MKNRKIGISTIEINKKFIDFKEASKYAKKLRFHINYICKKKGYQATAMTIVSNTKKGVSNTRYVSNGKKGRPKKELVINEYLSDKLYNGNCITDYHIHVLFVSKPSKMLVNHIKEYIDRRWFEIPNIRGKNINSSISSKKKVYKKTCNINLADYFIDQSSEIGFVNCNYSGEKDFRYTLKNYYSEYMKLYSNRKKLYNKQMTKPMSEERYLKQLEKIEERFDLVKSYFYSITEEQDKKDQKEYMEQVKLSKIKENCNKVQSIHRERNEKDSYY